MSKPLRVAGEVDSWCTRCRLLLNHRIVSMNGPKPHQVLCLTCHTQHLFRAAAPGERAPAEPRAARASSDGTSRPSRAPSASRAEQAELSREQIWEKAIAGRMVTDFKPYSVAAVFAEGDLVRHKKFGDGVISRVIDASKVEVLFRDETRTLAHGMKD